MRYLELNNAYRLHTSWCVGIPPLLYRLPSGICENHFEMKFYEKYSKIEFIHFPRDPPCCIWIWYCIITPHDTYSMRILFVLDSHIPFKRKTGIITFCHFLIRGRCERDASERQSDLDFSKIVENQYNRYPQHGGVTLEALFRCIPTRYCFISADVNITQSSRQKRRRWYGLHHDDSGNTIFRNSEDDRRLRFPSWEQIYVFLRRKQVRWSARAIRSIYRRIEYGIAETVGIRNKYQISSSEKIPHPIFRINFILYYYLFLEKNERRSAQRIKILEQHLSNSGLGAQKISFHHPPYLPYLVPLQLFRNPLTSLLTLPPYLTMKTRWKSWKVRR